MALSKLDSTALGTFSGNLSFASGQGIDFSATGDGSATMSNELLDDYERGTWVATDNSVAGLTFTQNAVAQYVKIGDLVLFSFYISFPTTSSTAAVSIGGLPYTVGTGYYYSAVRANGLGTSDLTFQINTAGTYMTLYHNNGGIQNSTMSGDYILASGSYIAA